MADIEKIVNDFNERLKALEDKQKELDSKAKRLDAIINKIENELFIDEEDGEDLVFEIACPYCNYNFEIEMDELKTEVSCPECNNIIELDWNCSEEHDDLGGHCSCCNGCEDTENYEDEDDDM